MARGGFVGDLPCEDAIASAEPNAIVLLFLFVAARLAMTVPSIVVFGLACCFRGRSLAESCLRLRFSVWRVASEGARWLKAAFEAALTAEGDGTHSHCEAHKMTRKAEAAFAEALPAVYLRIAGRQAGIC